jgi:hypothetical protein
MATAGRGFNEMSDDNPVLETGHTYILCAGECVHRHWPQGPHYYEAEEGWVSAWCYVMAAGVLRRLNRPPMF